MSSSEPRQHHYVPQLLLKRFTLNSNADGQLWNFDLKAHKQWCSTPKKSASERDYNRVECDDPEKSFQIENPILSGLEHDVTPIIDELVASELLPTKTSEMELLMYFIAVLSTRVPKFREQQDKTADVINRSLFKISTTSRSRWSSLQRQMIANGIAPDDLLSFEDAQRIAARRGRDFRSDAEHPTADDV